tara:strand:+ start:136 stop:372 length:237 start_codon:yes stop_codon:yes gene_type:complete
MENLWERLKPSVKDLIKEETKDFKSLGEELKSELQNKHWWSDLSVRTAQQLISFSHESMLEASLSDFMWGEKFFKISE